MRTAPALLALAVTAGLLAGCGERVGTGGTVRGEAAAGPTSQTPTPTTTPTPASAETPAPARSTARIPDDLDVDDHLPPAGGDFRRHDHGVAVELCGEEVFPVGHLADRRTVSVTGPEYGEGRDLRLFADVEAAEAFVAGVAQRFRSCPVVEHAGGSAAHHGLVRSTLDGDESFTAVQTYSQDGQPVLGASFWEVVRIGPAVLLTVTYGEYDPHRNLDQGIREHATDVTRIVEEMCAFAASPCPAR